MSNTTSSQTVGVRFRPWIGILLLSAFSVMINGCSLFSETKDNAELPAPLAVIQTEIAPRTLWSVDVGGQVGVFGSRLELALADDAIYTAAESGAVSAFATRTGELRWRTRVAGSIIGGVAVGEGLVVVSTVVGELVALDRRNGNIVWQSAVLRARQLTRPVVQGDFVVVGDFEGVLHWFSPQRGEIVGRVRLPVLGIDAAPVVDGAGTLFVLGTDGTLTALTLT